MYKNLLKKTFLSIGIIILFASCKNDSSKESDNCNAGIYLKNPAVKIVRNLQALGKTDFSSGRPQSKTIEPPFIGFNFDQYQIVKDDKEAHILFKGIEIKLGNNVEVALIKKDFNEVKDISDLTFKRDSGNNFAIKSNVFRGQDDIFIYNGNPIHRVNITPNRTLVFRIKDTYYKMSILSYYENCTPNKPQMPTNLEYYTFIYQLANSENKFE